MAISLDELIDQILKRADKLVPVVQWTGMTKDSTPTAKQLLELVPTIPEYCHQDLLKFYSGDQWDANVQVSRFESGRPCVVVNQLPAIVKRVMSKVVVFPDAACERSVILAITWLNQDAQRVYNYGICSLIELLSATIQIAVNPETGECTCPRCRTGKVLLCEACCAELKVPRAVKG